MGKFQQWLTELSACDRIMAGYYSLRFYCSSSIMSAQLLLHILTDQFETLKAFSEDVHAVWE